MKKVVIFVYITLMFLSSYIVASAVNNNWENKAEHYFKSRSIGIYRRISNTTSGNYYMLKAILEEERKQTELLRKLLEK